MSFGLMPVMVKQKTIAPVKELDVDNHGLLQLNKNLSQLAIPSNAKLRLPLHQNSKLIWINTPRTTSSQTSVLIEISFGHMVVMLKLRLIALVKELDADKPGK